MQSVYVRLMIGSRVERPQPLEFAGTTLGCRSRATPAQLAILVPRGEVSHASTNKDSDDGKQLREERVHGYPTFGGDLSVRC
jgi:hypothetical protein